MSADLARATRGEAPPPLPWGTVALGFMATCTVMGGRSVFAVLYPAMVHDLGWSVSAITTTYSVGLLAYAPAVVAAGFLLDRFGCRWTMVGGSALIVVGMLIVATGTELWHMYLGFALAGGVGSASAGFVPVMKMLSLRAPRRFAAAFGMAYIGQGFGAMVISPSVQLIIDAAGWRTGALVAVILGAVLMVMSAWLAPGAEVAAPRRIAHARQRQHGLFGLVFGLYFVGNFTLGYQMLIPTHQVAYLLEVGFVAITAATAAGVWGGLSALGGALGGWALERFGNTKMLLAAAVAGIAGIIAVLWVTPERSYLLVPFVVASGVGRGLQSIGLVAGQAAAFAGPRMGRMTGLLDLGFGLGAFTGPWLTGIAHDSLGSYGLGLSTAIVATVVVFFAAVAGHRIANTRLGHAHPTRAAARG